MLDAVSSTESTEDTLVRGGCMSTGAEGKSDDQRTVSTERLEGTSTTLGGEERREGTVEDGSMDGTLGYIMSRKACRIGSLGTTKSDRSLKVVPRLGCTTLGGTAIGPEGVENVSVGDVDGDGLPRCVRPKAGSGGNPGEGVRLSVIGESRVWRKEPTTDSV
jgi:hypothetical protein